MLQLKFNQSYFHILHLCFMEILPFLCCPRAAWINKPKGMLHIILSLSSLHLCWLRYIRRGLKA